MSVRVARQLAGRDCPSKSCKEERERERSLGGTRTNRRTTSSIPRSSSMTSSRALLPISTICQTQSQPLRFPPPTLRPPPPKTSREPLPPLLLHLLAFIFLLSSLPSSFHEARLPGVLLSRLNGFRIDFNLGFARIYFGPVSSPTQECSGPALCLHEVIMYLLRHDRGKWTRGVTSNRGPGETPVNTDNLLKDVAFVTRGPISATPLLAVISRCNLSVS